LQLSNINIFHNKKNLPLAGFFVGFGFWGEWVIFVAVKRENKTVNTVKSI